ncbi:hypothetical protein FC62_GL000684 [Amylolactobacillus amylotrophicus DSM 20534]|uniref:Uncharacterized protein n=3 Tax=Amylolactobacillus TaxID=2767876 RepID=A0A1L6XB01_9LACO|nr:MULTISPECIES: DUF4430 domain-containing protein [Amylolactobacillus]APT18150.1 hypothetical protein LA20533_02140 [Amylolactobacillus amylophilus DSM 20533 = JCM 1125]KRK37918.1 hypothetical protein FC62_GL000684 [Amylolactobacillus amylotrophicus DSM 20534]KRM42178.1 hypothetical protein FD40_GL000963 [Amylolactobacillus amylophilus DSM 20533 = JCM 1125]GED80269.1 hypothetical protein LAM01_07420 [Amylolactobacillus amylophilus]
MKKLLRILVVAVLPILLLGVGCSNQEKSTDNTQTKSSSVANQTATIKVFDRTNNKVLGNKKVSFKKGESVLAALKKSYRVTESKGFVSAINGVEQDDQAGAYWTFTVNGQDATKGAGEIQLAPKDKVVFKLSTYEK